MKTPITETMLNETRGQSFENQFRDAAALCEQLETAKNENWQEVLDWERWAKEVCEDFRIPFDNHKIGLRMAITQWMADKLRRDA